MKSLYNIVLDLEKEYDDVLKRYLELGGTTDYLEKSGITKTWMGLSSIETADEN